MGTRDAATAHHPAPGRQPPPPADQADSSQHTPANAPNFAPVALAAGERTLIPSGNDALDANLGPFPSMLPGRGSGHWPSSFSSFARSVSGNSSSCLASVVKLIFSPTVPDSVPPTFSDSTQLFAAAELAIFSSSPLPGINYLPNNGFLPDEGLPRESTIPKLHSANGSGNDFADSQLAVVAGPCGLRCLNCVPVLEVPYRGTWARFARVFSNDLESHAVIWRATLRRGRVRGTNGRDRSASLQHCHVVAAESRFGVLR